MYIALCQGCGGIWAGRLDEWTTVATYTKACHEDSDFSLLGAIFAECGQRRASVAHRLFIKV